MCESADTETGHEQVGVAEIERVTAQQAFLTGTGDGVRTTGDDDGLISWVGDHDLEKVLEHAAS